MPDLIIRNGHLLTPSGLIAAELAIDGERVAASGKELNGAAEIDAAGCHARPGGWTVMSICKCA